MTTAPTAQPWPPEVPHGCRSCGSRDYRHYGRGLCGACYQMLDRRGRLHDYALLRAHGNNDTDSWAASPAHRVVYRNHQRLRAAARDRQLRIWNTDGPLINPANCVLLTDPPPPRRFPAHGSGARRAA